MPPRDKGQEEHQQHSAVPLEPSANETNNVSPVSATQPSSIENLVKKSRDSVKIDHNTPTSMGWRRNTFHWELNLWTFGFLFVVYRYVVPESYRFGMQLLGGLIGLDAARYYYVKADMPGVPYTLPFVSLVAMIVQPVRFWAELGTIAMESGEGLCTNILGGSFMLFVTDTKLCRQIMTAEGTFQIFAHPNALWLFGPRNLIYMDTEPHK